MIVLTTTADGHALVRDLGRTVETVVLSAELSAALANHPLPEPLAEALWGIVQCVPETLIAERTVVHRTIH